MIRRQNNSVTLAFCHLYSMYRFLLICRNKRLFHDFIIEEPFIFTEKVSSRSVTVDCEGELYFSDMERLCIRQSSPIIIREGRISLR